MNIVNPVIVALLAVLLIFLRIVPRLLNSIILC